MWSPSLPRFVAAVLLLGATAGGSAYARDRLSMDGRVVPGVRVDGEELAEGADVDAVVRAHVERLRARRVRLVVEGETASDASVKGGGPHLLREATLAELGVTVDVDRVAALARTAGHADDPITQLELEQSAAAGEIDVPLQPTIDAEVVLAMLGPYKEDEDLAPVSARLDLDHHSVVHEKDGRYLDVDAAVAELSRVASATGYANDPKVTTVVVPMSSFTPRVSTAFLEKIDISQVVASYETPFSRAQGNRSRNVEVATARLNGVVLSPGAAMSFNEVVGARSVENGFQHAGEIFKGEMVDGVGGGTCQVASTLHAAAFFGGLDIIERLPHSRPSAYIELGLDATVVYPSVDLKLRNPFEFPVVIHAYVDHDKAKVELLGARHAATVKFGKTFIGSFPFSRKISEEAWVTKPTLKQKGMRGVSIRRVRTIVFDGGLERVESSIDTYPPVQEIYRVPPGYDPEELPAVGEDENASTVTGPPKPVDPKKPDSREGVVQHG